MALAALAVAASAVPQYTTAMPSRAAGGGGVSRRPRFRDPWSCDFAKGLANQLAYQELKTYLLRFTARRDLGVRDFLEVLNMHVPVLYMDVRNRLKFGGYVLSTVELFEGLVRGVFLLVRVMQDTAACEQVFGTEKIGGAPVLFHNKICAWLRAVLVPRDQLVDDDESSGGGGGGGGGGAPFHHTARDPEEADVYFTGWSKELSFLRVLSVVKQRVAVFCAPGQALPLPVWVPEVSSSFFPGTSTIYFGNATANMVAAATNNLKIDAVRSTATAQMLQAFTDARTWQGFMAIHFGSRRNTSAAAGTSDRRRVVPLSGSGRPPSTVCAGTSTTTTIAATARGLQFTEVLTGLPLNDEGDGATGAAAGRQRRRSATEHV
jgi:hypothetical protein